MFRTDFADFLHLSCFFDFWVNKEKNLQKNKIRKKFEKFNLKNLKRYLMAGIEHAMSFNTNPNKWMLVSLEIYF